MYYISKISKYLAFSSLFLLALLPIATHSATFYSPQDNDAGQINIQSSQDNVYAVGNEIASSESIRGDLSVAGNKINITATIGRSVQVAGYDIAIDSPSINGAVRAAGYNVSIAGNIAEEVIIIGNTVTIQNATIRGDLIVFAQELYIQDSVILGDAELVYSSGVSKEELDTMVSGNVNVKENNTDDVVSGAIIWTSIGAFVYAIIWVILFQLSIIISIVIVALWLRKRNRLILKTLDFGNQFWIRMAIGFGLVTVVPSLSLFLLLIQFFVPATLIILIVLALIFASVIYTPIYLSNIIANTIAKETNFVLILTLVYVIITILNFIPILNILTGLVYSLIALSSLGYLSQKLFESVGGDDISTSTQQIEPSKEYK
jgi:hypothetical protein